MYVYMYVYIYLGRRASIFGFCSRRLDLDAHQSIDQVRPRVVRIVTSHHLTCAKRDISDGYFTYAKRDIHNGPGSLEIALITIVSPLTSCGRGLCASSLRTTSPVQETFVFNTYSRIAVTQPQE